MSVGHALEDVLEPCEGLDVVKLCGGDEGADDCPSDAAAVRPREEMVFASERDGSDGALDRIVVEFDATVIQESGEGLPARERITNGSRREGRRVERGQAPSRAKASSSR